MGNRTNPLDRETTGFQYCGRYPEEPLTSTEDTGEVRRQLSRAWRAVGVRLLEEGYDPGDVAETMLAVALTTWSGLKDNETAARHLRSIAGELAPEDGSEVRSGGVARQRLRFLAQANRG